MTKPVVGQVKSVETMTLREGGRDGAESARGGVEGDEALELRDPRVEE